MKTLDIRKILPEVFSETAFSDLLQKIWDKGLDLPEKLKCTKAQQECINSWSIGDTKEYGSDFGVIKVEAEK